jgi:hypothetical protein
MRILKPGEYQWKETQGGTGWVLLRHDEAAGTQTRLLRYTRDITLPAAALTHTVEWLVLRGEARCGGTVLRRRGFYCWPIGERRSDVVPGAEGYTVISFAYGPGNPIRKPPVAIDSVDLLPWEAGEPWPGAGPLPRKRLNRDPASGAATEIVRLDPGRALAAFSMPRLLELFVLEGTAGLEGERLLPATYAAIEPGETCGPLTAEGAAPALLLVNRA